MSLDGAKHGLGDKSHISEPGQTLRAALQCGTKGPSHRLMSAAALSVTNGLGDEPSAV